MINDATLQQYNTAKNKKLAKKNNVARHVQ